VSSTTSKFEDTALFRRAEWPQSHLTQRENDRNDRFSPNGVPSTG